MDHRKSEECIVSRRGAAIARRRSWISAALGAAAPIFLAAVFLVAGGPRTARAQSVNITASVPPSSTISLPIEESYRWYANVDALDPATPLAAEGATSTTPVTGTAMRLRMNVLNGGGVALPTGTVLMLQYANATSGPWATVGGSGAAWGFTTNPSVSDGSILATLLLSSSTVGESYGSSNPSAASPAALATGDYGEWDWSLANVSATTSANWFFRMAYSSGTLLSGYAPYPELAATTTPSGGPSGGGGGGGGSVVQVGGGGGVPPTGPSATASSAPPIIPSTSSPPFVPPPPAACAADASLATGFRRSDLDCDGRVDIVDLSILLYYYGQAGPRVARYDFNNDGSVGFDDVSILMYYWTGPFAAAGSTAPYA